MAVTLAACGSEDEKKGNDSCQKSCAKALEAHCPKDSAEECANGCAQADSTPFCRPEIDAGFACGATAMYVCDSGGHSLPVGCDDVLNNAARCLGPYLDGGNGG
jgi:hypothetical protein